MVENLTVLSHATQELSHATQELSHATQELSQGHTRMTNLTNDDHIADFGNTSHVTEAFHNFTAGVSSEGSVDNSESDGGTKNIVVPSVMFFLGVVGNVTALVILTVKPSKDSRSSAFYHLVKALACMDLFGIVVSSPVTVIVYVTGGILKTGGMPLCHFISFILVMAGNATVFTVLIMAVERFMVTKYPFQYNQVVSPLVVNCSVGTVWGVSSIIALLPVIGVSQNIDHWPGTWCFFDYRSTTLHGQVFSYFYAISGLLAIIATMILNAIVIHHLWRMRRSRLIASPFRPPEEISTKNGGSGLGSEMRMVIFLMAIIVVFTVCYAPLMVRIIENQMWNAYSLPISGGLDDTMDIWALRLACINQILDPWVYIISRVTCCSGVRGK